MTKMIALIALLFAGSAQAAVCFYEHAAFQGQSACLEAGATYSNLAGDFWQDRASSIRFNPQDNLVVEACANADFAPPCMRFTTDVWDLSALNFNDKISSVSVRQVGMACFYEHANFQGIRYCVKEGETVMNLAQVILNNKISSIQIMGDVVVKACPEAGLQAGSDYFGGHIPCRQFTKDVTNLQYHQFNDMISSLAVFERY